MTAWLFLSPASAQTSYQTDAGKMLLFHTSAATQVVEKVRASVPGVMTEIYVDPGDAVVKGQILGHTELDAAKLQLDLAKNLLDNKANVKSAEGQAEAWTVAREETEEAARRRDVSKTRVDWATAMEKMYRANLDAQIEAETTQEIQYRYAKDQYEKRFIRATTSGVVSEVMVEVGKPVNFSTHVFTIKDEGSYTIPLTVPSSVASAISPSQTLPIRSEDGKTVKRAKVESVMEDPRSTGLAIVRLIIAATDFPSAMRSKIKGMKFDVLLPQLASEASR